MFDASYFEHAPCGLVVMEADGTLLRCNATFGNWLGYDVAQLKQRSFDQLLTTVGRTFQLTHWGPLLNLQGSISEVKVGLRHRDGHVVAMLLNAVRRETAEGVRFQLALFSTSERDRNEHTVFQAMQRAEELLAQKSAPSMPCSAHRTTWPWPTPRPSGVRYWPSRWWRLPAMI